MRIDDYDGQMIFGDLVGLKLPDISLTGEEKPRKNLTQDNCPNRGSNPGPLRDRRACYRLLHSGGHYDSSYEIVTALTLQLFECRATWRGVEELATISRHVHSESGLQKKTSMHGRLAR